MDDTGNNRMPEHTKPRVAAAGDPSRLGMTETRDGCNFAVFSRHATDVALLIFDAIGPVVTLPLDPVRNRTGDVWHIAVSRDAKGMSYAFRVGGPAALEQGHRFDRRPQLLDPYAVALAGATDWEHERPGATLVDPACFARGLVVDDVFDWEDDSPPRHPWESSVIYETHVRGLTFHSSSGVAHRGSYAGLVEKIPYLRALGITAVELMPVQEFRECEIAHRTGKPLRNYWGYNPVSLFAPKASYAGTHRPAAALVEFRTMVRELHRAGVEVILDVVFNHTAEGGEDGPTISFRGLDNAVYYLLQPDKRRYVDFTGCGNTLNCNHPVVRTLIVDCLRRWVVEFHVDGFRFDLASILGRDQEGRLLSNPPVLEEIAEHPILRDVKLIAEAWDLGGAFQVGAFPGQRWAEWNCHFRDEVRRFWRGDPGMTGVFATRLGGSSDLFGSDQDGPLSSVNFVTCHDGFTLNDLVSYARKHNEENGEDNRDGISENYSENNGVEGPSDDAGIEALRLRQIKNFLVTLLVSRGVPMLLGGDEFRRTQRGNNNAYCQDNEISWYDWRLVETNAGLVRFVWGLIAFRKAHPVLSASAFYRDGEIAWIGADGAAPEWHGWENRIGCAIAENSGSREGGICLLFNASLRPCRFLLPPAPCGQWRVIADTSRDAPDDLPEVGRQPTAADGLELAPRTSVVLACGTPR
ncbi:MAG: glycogen operon protein GlgX homolog [Alphaproteobacteria bacterium]|nr:MAG: glycogen operon protein GlgX homolog [Alphaproteobacteria bacterium]